MATTPSDEPLTLALKLANHPSTSSLSLPRSSSVLDLKQKLSKEWEGKPKLEGITVVKGGRVLRDTEKLMAVFEDELSEEVRSPFSSLIAAAGESRQTDLGLRDGRGESRS